MASTASADTLREALVSAYHTNPTLTAQRQTLESSDAQVAIAKAAGRPQISATVGLNRNLTQTGVLVTGGKGPTLSAGATLSYPLFNGGSVRNNVKAAETRVEAGRATLRAVDGDVFTNAVASYMDVIRDRAIVELNQNNVKVLQTNLEATRDRFQIGDLTRTDVAQSEARLQLGYAQLATAQGNSTASEATYRQQIGHPPGELAPPPPLPPLPANADEAVRIALASNPDLLSITRQEIASGFRSPTPRASLPPRRRFRPFRRMRTKPCGSRSRAIPISCRSLARRSLQVSDRPPPGRACPPAAASAPSGECGRSRADRAREQSRSPVDHSPGDRFRFQIAHPPGELAPPPPLPPLPANADEAVRIALASNPDLLSITRQEIASGF